MLALLPHSVALLLDLSVIDQLVLDILLEHKVDVVKVCKVRFILTDSDSKVLKFAHVPISLDFGDQLPGCLVLVR